MADLFDLELELHDGGGPSRSSDAPDITRFHPRHQMHMHHHVHQDDSDDEDDEVIEVDNDMVSGKTLINILNLLELYTFLNSELSYLIIYVKDKLDIYKIYFQ